MKSIFEHLVEAVQSGDPFALALIADVKGSSPQKKGAKALFFADGRILGTLGGGCLEAEVRERARAALMKREPASFDLVLDHDFGWDDGLICGGRVCGLILPRPETAAELWRQLAARDREMEWGVNEAFEIHPIDAGQTRRWLFREMTRPPMELWIAGSGHLAQALAPLADQLDFRVTVFDDRPDLANHRYFPKSTRLCVGPWDRLLAEAKPAGPAFGIIVTRGHQHDALVLREWIRRPFAFLGMIGSRRKWRLIRSQFSEENLATEAQLDRVACPVGFPIGDVTVPEIAISIVAQLIQERANFQKGHGSRQALAVKEPGDAKFA